MPASSKLPLTFVLSITLFPLILFLLAAWLWIASGPELQEIQTADLSSWMRQFIPMTPIIATLSALASVAIGLGLTIFIHRQRSNVINSYQMLLGRFQIAISLGSWLLSLSVLAQFISIICSLACLLYISHQYFGINYIVVMGAVFIAYFIWKIKDFLIKKNPDNSATVLGQDISRQQAPALWSVVDEVAQKLETTPPDHIILSLNEGFWVTDFNVNLPHSQTRAGEKTMCLSIPFMNHLILPEFKAIIGHELAHFIHRDLIAMRAFNQLYQHAGKANNALDDIHARFIVLSLLTFGFLAPVVAYCCIRPIQTLSAHLFIAFHESERAWNRKGELAADAIAARVGGPEDIASSLAKLALLTPAMIDAQKQHMRVGNQSPILALMAQSIETNGYPTFEELKLMEQPHPYDSHPPLQERLAALNITFLPADYQAFCTQQQTGALLHQLQLH